MGSAFEEKLYNALYSVFRQWMGREPRQERLEVLRDTVEKLAAVLAAGSSVEAAEVCSRMQPVIAGAFADVGKDYDKLTKKIRDLEKKVQALEEKPPCSCKGKKELPPNMDI